MRLLTSCVSPGRVCNRAVSAIDNTMTLLSCATEGKRTRNRDVHALIG